MPASGAGFFVAVQQADHMFRRQLVWSVAALSESCSSSCARADTTLWLTVTPFNTRRCASQQCGAACDALEDMLATRH